MKRSEPIRLSENDIIKGNLYGEVRMYPINKEQFELLIKGQSRYKEYSGKFIWAGVGISLKVLGTCIAIVCAYHNGKTESDVERINNIDLYSISICIAIAIILFVIDRLVKSPRKTLISKIQAKFEEEGHE